MSTSSTSPWQFAVFRILFGSYLAVHFLALIPYGTELFGHDGLIGDPSLNPAAGLFPNPLDLRLPGAVVAGILAGLAGLSVMLAAGLMRPVVCLLLWFGWTALFHRNNLIANPSIPYVGLMLVLCALVPGGEPLSLGKRRDDAWEMPVWVPRCAWILLAAGYTFSGITKFSSPSWVDGSAMGYLLENPLARPGMMREVMLGLPEVCLKGLTWFTLAAELAYLPLALWRKSAPWIWCVLVGMHLGIVLVVDFADLSVGMLMVHAFTFDRRWVDPATGNIVVAYDGMCMMCSRFIRFIAGEDAGRRVGFTTLQGEEGRAMEAAAGSAPLGSLVVAAGGRVLVRSSAVLAVFSALGGMWRVAALAGGMVPRGLRDGLYDFIAARRHRWFRAGDVCGLPSAAVRERISNL